MVVVAGGVSAGGGGGGGCGRGGGSINGDAVLLRECFPVLLELVIIHVWGRLAF